MRDFRCVCKKMLFQMDDYSITIKCRNCKRFIKINTKGIINFETKLNDNEINFQPSDGKIELEE